MGDKIDDIVVPILRNIQGDVATLKADVSVLKADVSILKEAVRRIDSRIGTMESFMAGFHGSLRWQGDELDHLRGRIERLEDKNNPPPPADPAD